MVQVKKTGQAPLLIAIASSGMGGQGAKFIMGKNQEESDKKGRRLEALTQNALQKIEGMERDAGNTDAGVIARRGRVAGSRFHVLEEATRLMPVASQALTDTDASGRANESGAVWWAESLKAPRGRMQRSWWAPRGGIYFALALYPELTPEHYALYSLAMGMAVTEALKAAGADARIRWINDVLIGGKKVSGTLTETVYLPDSCETWIVLGTGINVNIKNLPGSLPHATSVFLETGRILDIEVLGASVIAWFGWYAGLLHHWDSACSGEYHVPARNPLLERWRMLSDTTGRPLRFGTDLENSRGDEGFCMDILDSGALLIQTSEGEYVEFDSGEVRYV